MPVRLQIGAGQRAERQSQHGDGAAAEFRVLMAAGRRVGGDAGQRHGEHGGRQVRHRQFAGRGVLDAHRRGQQHDEQDDMQVDVACGREVQAGLRGTRDGLGVEPAHRRFGGEAVQQIDADQGRQHERRLHAGRRQQMPDVMVAVMPDDASAGGGPDDEGDQRQGRGPPDEALRVGDREAQKDDVAGHVGHEHVPQRQIAQGVHQTCHEGEYHQRGGEQPVAVVLAWDQRASCFGEM